MPLIRPVGPPTKVESFGGKTLLWWFGDDLHARCGVADVVLDHHPVLFPATRWSVELFGEGPGPDQCWHYSGRQFVDMPTDDKFREVATAMLQALYRSGRL